MVSFMTLSIKDVIPRENVMKHGSMPICLISVNYFSFFQVTVIMPIITLRIIKRTNDM